MSLTAEEIESAWGILGASAAGRNARVRLVEVLSSLCPNGENASALLRHEGKRILARELLTLMDKHPSHDGRDANDDYPSSRRSAVSLRGKRSLRRVGVDADGKSVDG